MFFLWIIVEADLNRFSEKPFCTSEMRDFELDLSFHIRYHFAFTMYRSY